MAEKATKAKASETVAGKSTNPDRYRLRKRYRDEIVP